METNDEKIVVEEACEEVKAEPTKKEKVDKKEKKLLDQLQKAKEEADLYKDKYYRAIADMDNQRKRYDKEYSDSLKYQSQSLAEKLLPSFEMFQTVLESKDNLPEQVRPYIMGFDMIYRQMVQALESAGVSEIVCKVGDVFDHTIHYAMETEVVEDEKLVDHITKICSKGYKIHDRLLKPVTVYVGKKKVVNDNKTEEVKENKEENKGEN